MTRGTDLREFEQVVLLALICLGDDAYGVPICHEIEKRSGREAALANVYTALERLEEKGFVISRPGESTAVRGGRAKRYYHVTNRGVRDLRQTRPVLIDLWRDILELDGGLA